jgi:hypothetical protein
MDIGKAPHSSTSLKTLQQNLASTHCKKISSALSNLPQSLHSVGPCQFFFASCSADCTLSLHTCHKNILIFKGRQAAQMFLIHLLSMPGKVRALYRNPETSSDYSQQLKARNPQIINLGGCLRTFVLPSQRGHRLSFSLLDLTARYVNFRIII